MTEISPRRWRWSFCQTRHLRQGWQWGIQHRQRSSRDSSTNERHRSEHRSANLCLWPPVLLMHSQEVDVHGNKRYPRAGFLHHVLHIFTLSGGKTLHFNGHFTGEPGLAGVYWSKGWWRWWWQLDYWSYKSCKAPVKSSPPTNQHPVFLQDGCPSCHLTNSVKALSGGKTTYF